MKKEQQGIWFIVIALAFAIIFYWGIKELVLPYLPTWVSSLLLYERKYTVLHHHANSLIGISGAIGGIGSLFLLSYLRKKQ